jgi:Xaa-Pro aminopeptidase
VIDVPLRAARSALLPGELARYRALCRDAAQIVTGALAEATPQMTERQLAARIAHDITAVGAEPVVLMAAGESRLQHRHPLATDAPIGARCMVVLGARRHGMITNLTRWLRFGSPTAADTDAASALLEVEAEFFAATSPGASVSDAFTRGCASYWRLGFRADEWERHHQGGVAGYNGRDPRATTELPDVFADNGVVSWNPTAPSLKVEDTVLVTSPGLEVLTADEAWPTVVVGGLARPLELQL